MGTKANLMWLTETTEFHTKGIEPQRHKGAGIASQFCIGSQKPRKFTEGSQRD
jgi:hypothetical protein